MIAPPLIVRWLVARARVIHRLEWYVSILMSMLSSTIPLCCGLIGRYATTGL